MPSLGTWIVLIPAIHVVLTVIYLWAYGVGFGAGIRNFIQPEDVFSTAINAMIPVYCLGLVLPVASTAARFWGGRPYAQDHVDVLPVNDRPRAMVKLRRSRIISLYILGFVSIWGIGAAIWAYLVGIPILAVLTIAGPAGFLVVACAKAKDRWGWTVAQFEAATTGICLLLSTVGMGVGMGQIERFANYRGGYVSGAFCGSAVIIRPVGGMYLAQGPHRKVLIDQDCTTKFEIPNPRPLRANRL